MKQTNVFHRIISTADSIKLCTGAVAPPEAPKPASMTLPLSPRLPPTPCIRATLEACEAPPSLVRYSSHSYQRHASQLHKRTEAAIRELIDKHISNEASSSNLLEEHIALIATTYYDRLNNWEAQLARKLQNHAASAVASPCSDAKPERSTFNTEFVPLLESYFEHNAFPSAIDRHRLARESGNSPRQIEIWFQNRRRRLRKIGVQPKRLSPDQVPLNLRFDNIQKQLPAPIALKEKHRSVVQPPTPVDNAIGSSACQPVLGTAPAFDFSLFEVPSYAFPAKYNKDASQCLWSRPRVSECPKPHWERKPTLTHPQKATACSDEELSMLVAEKLRLFSRDTSGTETRWYATRYTYPSPAPLPSLINHLVFSGAPPTTGDMQTTLSLSNAMTPASVVKPSRKRKRQELDERPVNKQRRVPVSRSPPILGHDAAPAPIANRRKRQSSDKWPTNNQRRSVSTSSSASISSYNSSSSEDSDDFSSPGPKTPPATFVSPPPTSHCLHSPRYIDWPKFKIPTVPILYGFFS